MAISYLVKVGGYTIPLSAIEIESYSVTYSTLDLDSYRDANGVLHRTVLDHKVAKVEFNIPKGYADEVVAILNNIRSNYSDAKAKEATVSCYVPEINGYVEQTMYVPDITTKILQNSKGGFIFDSTRVAFIGK